MERDGAVIVEDILKSEQLVSLNLEVDQSVSKVNPGLRNPTEEEMIDGEIRTHEAATIDITPEMKKAILEEGVNVMYKGGIVNKVKSMDKPIQGNRREM